MTSSNNDLTQKEALEMYLKFLFRCTSFHPSMVPFSSRPCGPELFTRPFPPVELTQVPESKAIWKAFLIPRIIVSMVGANDAVTLMCYQPNMVARKFGLCQPLPRSFYKLSVVMCLSSQSYNEVECA